MDPIFFLISAPLRHFPGQVRLINNPVTTALMGLVGAQNEWGKFHIWSVKRVAARRNGDSEVDRPDMMSHFMNMKSLDRREPATDNEVLTEASTLIGAGADTTSTGLRACIYYLWKSPESYARLQQEIDRYYEDNNLTEPISYNQTQEIPYLKAAVSESLRLFPSVSFQLLRYCSEVGMDINGHHIPAGYSIGISPTAQNHDEAVYGKDANRFCPERWLGSAKDRTRLESANITFGSNSPRSCIGKNISLVEISKFVAQLLRNVDVEFVDENHPWHITSYWFSYQHDMKMKIKLRPGRTVREVQGGYES